MACSRLPALSPCWWPGSVLPPQAAQAPVPLGAGRGGGTDPSPAPASLLLSPAPRPSLLWAPGTCPFPTSSCPLTCSDSHISLYLAHLQISQKKKKKPTQPSRSPCLRPLVPQAGLHVLSTSSHGVRLLVSSPLPASSPPSIPQPPGPQPGSLSGACPMLFRPTCSQGSQAEVWTPAPPPASLLASPRSLPEPRSSCPADRNLCPRGAWGWRARDRQQTRSTSRGVGGDERWRTQRRGGADRKHGKRQRSGQR